MGQDRSGRLSSVLPWVLLPALLCVGFGFLFASFQGQVTLQDVFPAFLLSLGLPLIACVIALPLAISTAILLHRRYNRRDSVVIARILDALAAVPPIVAAYASAYLLTRWGMPYSKTMAVLLLIIAFLPRLTTQTLDSLRALPPHAYSAIRAMGSRRISAVYGMLLRQAAGGITNGAILLVLNGLNELALLQIALGLFLSLPSTPVYDILPLGILLRNGVLAGNTALVAIAGFVLFSADILLGYAAKRALGRRA